MAAATGVQMLLANSVVTVTFSGRGDVRQLFIARSFTPSSGRSSAALKLRCMAEVGVLLRA